MTATTCRWEDRLREVLDGRPVIVAMDVLVAAAAVAVQLRALGVRDLLLLAGVRGVGDIDPDLEDLALVLGVGARAGGSVMTSIRSWQATLDDLPASACERIDAFDPDGRAWVVSALFHVGDQVAGREVLGARRPEWVALEDKTTVDELWDRVGVARAPSRVIDLGDDVAVAEAAATLDLGAGTCWVADNTTGWHGGGEFLRWTGPAGDATTAVAELRASGAGRARVMPFLEGRPCSIHGWVFDDHVAALRPCEMVVWRDDDHRFVYGGAATVWEPPAADREQMREVARRVGAALREQVDYRGTFTVDGVLTDDGFRPTELNPRFGGALSRMAEGIQLPLYLVHLATVSRPDLDWQPRRLEEAVLRAADASPVARVMRILPDGARSGTWWLRRTGTSWAHVEEVDPARAEVVLQVGAGVTGGSVAFVTLTGLGTGEAAAPAVAALGPAIASRVGVDLPVVHAAPERRWPERR